MVIVNNKEKKSDANEQVFLGNLLTRRSGSFRSTPLQGYKVNRNKLDNKRNCL